MDKFELMLLAIEYENDGESELAKICEKSAKYLEEKEKSTAECSA